jgi:ABC-type tungstate transport system substrate-binding protein
MRKSRAEAVLTTSLIIPLNTIVIHYCALPVPLVFGTEAFNVTREMRAIPRGLMSVSTVSMDLLWVTHLIHFAHCGKFRGKCNY